MLLFLLLFYFLQLQTNGFETQQRAYPRVSAAYRNTQESIRQMLDSHKISPSSLQVLIRVLKREQRLELWAKGQNQVRMQKIRSYNICRSSGRLGPKRKQGDGQVPEGFYHVERFKPDSDYHLALGINYPNSADQILGEKGNLGSAIMIHGSCVTIGCIPMTDTIIEEIYILAVKAQNAGQRRIPVYIFPTDLSGDGLERLMKDQGSDKAHFKFWRNLKVGWDVFERRRHPLVFSVNSGGRYQFGDH